VHHKVFAVGIPVLQGREDVNVELMVPKDVQNRDRPIGESLQPVQVVCNVASQHQQISLRRRLHDALSWVTAPYKL